LVIDERRVAAVRHAALSWVSTYTIGEGVGAHPIVVPDGVIAVGVGSGVEVVAKVAARW
jgi:hypothetical protein